MVTVALPVYAPINIAWLAMESLCNQKTNIDWELIIYEDEQYPMGEKFYLDYSARLIGSGCVNLKYKYYSERIPLSYKWQEMALMSDNRSVAMLLQAVDNYSNPNRIQATYEAFKEYNCDWYSCEKSLFYRIKDKKMMLFDNLGKGVGSDMAINIELAKQLPKEIKWQSVDNWVFSSLKKIKPDLIEYLDKSNDWMGGLATDGRNRISKHRDKLFDNPIPPFYSTEIRAEIPNRYFNKLWKLNN